MSDAPAKTPASDAGEGFARKPTGVLVLASGEVFYGEGFGAVGAQVAEVCFNTAMTGYQEILTDPSYAGQIVCFTFPHIGNVGANGDDMEAKTTAVRGLIVKARPTAPSNYRAATPLPDWLAARGIVGLAGIDTRPLSGRGVTESLARIVPGLLARIVLTIPITAARLRRRVRQGDEGDQAGQQEGSNTHHGSVSRRRPLNRG